MMKSYLKTCCPIYSVKCAFVNKQCYAVSYLTNQDVSN